MSPSKTAIATGPQVKTQSVKPPGKDRVERVIVQAEVSTMVQWYQNADPRDDPVPALVTRKAGADRVNLWVFNAGGLQQFERRNVPHMSDPILTVRKQVVAGPPRGAWDFCPDAVPERYRHLNAMEYRILLLNQLHSYTAFQVAAALGGGWSEKLVQAVLDRHAEKGSP